MREALTETTGAGMPGFMHLFDAAPRPRYKFNVQVGPLLKTHTECLAALHAFHQGNKSFFWDGGWYGAQPGHVLIGEGNGRTQEFFTPNRYLGAVGSVAVRTLRPSTGASSDWATSAWTVWLNPGLIRLTTAPASGDNVQAQYSCYYRVVFQPEGFRLEQVATDLYMAQFDLVEYPVLGSERPG